MVLHEVGNAVLGEVPVVLFRLVVFRVTGGAAVTENRETHDDELPFDPIE